MFIPDAGSSETAGYAALGRVACSLGVTGVFRVQAVWALAGRRRIFDFLSCGHGLLSLGKLASVRLGAFAIVLDSGTTWDATVTNPGFHSRCVSSTVECFG